MTTRLKDIPRTSETELHLMGSLLDRHAHRPFYATQKMDGFSMSFGNVDGSFVISARDRMVHLNESSPFAEAFRSGAVRPFADDAVLQGELCGPGILGNPHKLFCLEFFAFDLIVNGQPVGLDALRKFCRANFIEMVPMVAENIALNRHSAAAIAIATSGEGAVFRPMTEATDEFQGRVSFKVFNPSYAFHH